MISNCDFHVLFANMKFVTGIQDMAENKIN